MRNNRTLFVYAGAATFSLLAYGFVLFAAGASRGRQQPAPNADAIVVLTGADRRIKAGLDLLRQGLGSRLLISGINSRVSPGEVLRLNDVSPEAAHCCIDFGYEALDTIGNAHEARAWAEYHRFTRLLVVTSSYHMPRSLNELALELPGVELIPYPITPRVLGNKPWWLNPAAARMLAAEYVKLVPSYLKYSFRKLFPGEMSLTKRPSPIPQQRAAAHQLDP